MGFSPSLLVSLFLLSRGYSRLPVFLFKYNKRAHKPLDHDKQAFPAPAEITYQTEKYRGKKTVDDICLEVIVRRGDHRCIGGKDGC